MTPAEFIDAINLHLRSGDTASRESLALVTQAIQTFPDCAELWFLHGRVTMAAEDDDVVDSAARSFEMAVLLDPSMQEAHAALESYHRTASARRLRLSEERSISTPWESRALSPIARQSVAKAQREAQPEQQQEML